MNLTLGYYAYPRGTLADPLTQQVYTPSPSSKVRSCLNNEPTNAMTQIGQYYDATSRICQCLRRHLNSLLALVWYHESLLCECPFNSMYNSASAKRICQCTAIIIAPSGTVKPTLNSRSGNCECPSGTTMNWTSKVCVCPTDYNIDLGRCS